MWLLFAIVVTILQIIDLSLSVGVGGSGGDRGEERRGEEGVLRYTNRLKILKAAVLINRKSRSHIFKVMKYHKNE